MQMAAVIDAIKETSMVIVSRLMRNEQTRKQKKLLVISVDVIPIDTS